MVNTDASPVKIYDASQSPLTWNMKTIYEVKPFADFSAFAQPWYASTGYEYTQSVNENELCRFDKAYSVSWLICVHKTTVKEQLLLSDMNISQEEAMEIRMRFRSFEQDWDAPGMEAYDEL